MLHRALFAQSQPKRLAVHSLDFCAFFLTATVATAPFGVRLFQTSDVSYDSAAIIAEFNPAAGSPATSILATS